MRRFTDHGGVSLRVWLEGNDLMVSIADSGRALPAKI